MSDRIQSSNLGTLTQELLASEVPLKAEETSEIISKLGWRPTGAAMLVASVWKKAVSGDVNSAKLIREMNGEIENDSSAVNLSNMSDAMLRRMAEGIGNPTTADVVPPLAAARSPCGSDLPPEGHSTPLGREQSSLPLGKGGREKEYEVPW